MNKYFFIICTILFQSYTLAQITNPDHKYNYANNDITKVTKPHAILPREDYPWGVCLHYYKSLTNDEKNWTRQAMYLWNTRYKTYVANRWNDWVEIYIAGLPSLRPDGDHLFIESCNKYKYTLIYVKKSYLQPWLDDNDAGVLGGFTPIDRFGALTYFYGMLEMQIKKQWTRNIFINTMMHELGHALGINHLPYNKTQLMNSNSDSYSCKKKTQECQILDYDIDNFVSYYKKYYKQDPNITTIPIGKN